MKNVLYVFLIILGIIIGLIGLYILFNIYFVFSQVDGQLYDGFGAKYVNNAPSSVYTLIGIIGTYGGATLSVWSYRKLKGIK